MINYRGCKKSFFIFKLVSLFSLISLLGCDSGVLVTSTSIPTQINIGEDNITYIDGSPFFPIGMFAVYCYEHFKLVVPNYDTFDEIFSDIRDGGFNIVQTYQTKQDNRRFLEFLEHAEEYGLKIIMPPPSNNSHATTLIEDVYRVMSASALLSWYLVDEPDGQGIFPSVVKKYHDLIKYIDPYHLTSTVIGGMSNYADYMNVSDIFILDTYPIGKSEYTSVTQVSDYVDAAFEAMREVGVSKPLWVVLQAFGYQDDDNRGWGRDREPTYEEMRCMTYLAIVHGAKGIFYYCYGTVGFPGSGSSYYFIPNSPKHWLDLKSITRELEQLIPVLVSMDDTIEYLDANSPEIHFLLKYLDGRKYLFAVNSTNNEIMVTFSGFQNESNEVDSDTLSVLFEDREIAINGGVFNDHFDSYEVHIYAQKD